MLNYRAFDQSHFDHLEYRKKLPTMGKYLLLPGDRYFDGAHKIYKEFDELMTKEEKELVYKFINQSFLNCGFEFEIYGR
jgi:hypothetical protein